MSLHYSGDKIYVYVNKIQIYEFEGLGNIIHSKAPCQLCLRSVSKDFLIKETKAIALNGTIYDFLTDFGLIGVKDILQIHEYLMKKHNIDLSILCFFKERKNKQIRLRNIFDDKKKKKNSKNMIKSTIKS